MNKNAFEEIFAVFRSSSAKEMTIITTKGEDIELNSSKNIRLSDNFFTITHSKPRENLKFGTQNLQIIAHTDYEIIPYSSVYRIKYTAKN